MNEKHKYIHNSLQMISINIIVLNLQDRISHLRHLALLDLSYNKIVNGLRGLVNKNINLEEFKIRNNLLRSIDGDVFKVCFHHLTGETPASKLEVTLRESVRNKF